MCCFLPPPREGWENPPWHWVLPVPWPGTVSYTHLNYVDNVVLMSADTYQSAFADWQANTALLNVNGDTEALAETLTGLETFTGVTQLSTTRENVDSALSCLDYIICLIVLFSGALAFIVIFNLTNINLAERSREIATVEVLRCV